LLRRCGQSRLRKTLTHGLPMVFLRTTSAFAPPRRQPSIPSNSARRILWLSHIRRWMIGVHKVTEVHKVRKVGFPSKFKSLKCTLVTFFLFHLVIDILTDLFQFPER
jgi:hypothetical protein